MIVANDTVRIWKEGIPEHWQVMPLKHAITYNEDKLSDQSDDEYEFDYVDIGSVTYGKGIETYQHMKFGDAPSRARRIVQPKDVIMSTVRTYLKATAKIEEHDNPVIVSTGFMVMRARNGVVLPDFLGYVAQSDGLVSEIECQSYGTSYPAINAGEIANLSIPIPPLPEQQSIVRYLDSKCSAIDEAIERHKKIIEKMEEYRKAVVSDAIVHGLDKCVPVKASGIFGIGDIPTHFSSTRVKFLGTYRNGLTYSPADVCNSDEGTLVLRSSNIQDGKLTLDDNVYVNCPIDERIMVKDGDILICARNGSAKLVGKSAIIEGVHATYGAFMMVLRTTAVPKYMYYMLNSVVMDVYRASFSTTTVNQLTAGILGNMVIPYCPDKVEQRAIADYLDEKCAAINDVIESHQGIVNKLEEYRKSIIYNAVTGKIDCREAVK